MLRRETRAVTLYYHDVGEADRVVTFLTKDFGRFASFANGVRRLKSKLGGSLEPFNEVVVSFYRRKETDPWKVENVQLQYSFFKPTGSFQNLLWASYAARLAVAFTAEENRETSIFDLFLSFLRLLEKKGEAWLYARIYELKLFACSGHRLELAICSNCGKDEDTQLVSFNSGGKTCNSCAPSFKDLRRTGLGSLAFMRTAQEIDLHLMGRLKAGDSVLKEVASLTGDYTSYITGREIVPPNQQGK